MLEDLFCGDMLSLIERTRAEEIRIKRGECAVIISNGKAVYSSLFFDNNKFDSLILKACDNSYYSHEEAIKKGYINAGNGVRIGVCGRAVIDKESIRSVVDIDYLVIRIPRYIKDISLDLIRAITEPSNKSLLIYSPPGQGKTTLIRDIAVNLSSKKYNKRVIILDSREEIYIDSMPTGPLLAVYRGYPKKEALEAAIRTLSPDFLITDEIGTVEEALELERQLSSGVSVIATAHGAHIVQLLKKPGIAPLHELACFDLYCKITRSHKGIKFMINTREEAAKCLSLQELR